MVNGMKKYLKENGTIQTLLACPIATSYFTSFLSTEMSLENLQCYFDAKSLLDLCKYNKKAVMFQFNIINEFEQQAAKSIAMKNNDTEQSKKELWKQRSNSKLIEKPSNNDLKKTADKERDYSVDMISKIQKFLDRYISETALTEVNIDANLRKSLMEQFQAVKSLREELMKGDQSNSDIASTANQLKEAVEIFENSFDALINQLLSNMNDSFARFKASSLCNEALSVLLSSEDTNHQREKLLNVEKEGVILNTDVKWTQSTRSPLTTVTDLLKSVLNIFKAESLWIWDNELRTIQLNSNYFYSSLENITWKKIADSSAELSKVDLSLLKADEEKMAFWINTFNLMLIHAVLVAHDIPVLDVDREQFFRKTKYVIDGDEYSLQDIREGILLGNQSKSLIFGKQFKKRDKRRKNIVEKPTILVLFALTDLLPQSIGIQVIESDNIHEKLQDITKRYVNNFIHIEDEKKIILPLSLAHRKNLFKKFSDENNMHAKTSEEAIVNFVEKYSSILKEENINSYEIVFERPKPFITNIACVLSDELRAELELKIRTSDENKEQQQQTNCNYLSIPSSGSHTLNTKKRNSLKHKCLVM